MHPAGAPSLNPGGPHAEPPPRRTVPLFLAVAAGAYLLDLATKVAAVQTLSDRAPVPVIGELLQLTLVRNPGAAFGTGTSYTLVLTLIAMVAVVVVVRVSRGLTSRLWAFGLGCLLGGVLGNLTDRLFRQPAFLRGHVVDWIQLPNWPVFNVADICINVAAGVILLQAFRGVSHNGRSTPRPEADR